MEGDKGRRGPPDLVFEHRVGLLVALHELREQRGTTHVRLDIVAEVHEDCVDEGTGLGGDRTRECVDLLLAFSQLLLDVAHDLREPVVSVVRQGEMIAANSQLAYELGEHLANILHPRWHPMALSLGGGRPG